ncbi:terminase small subunit [Lysinibacillus sp. AR18-8]|uniref:terminase small subunit n=1 Tax=Lysinibacillus sp. AR18-8 TaxID=1889781 RepID=UPI0009F59441|nr:terminase small subunit [Lysinibacillus sp. AR18-8]
MARVRDPNRDKALEIYMQHDGKITNRAIAEILGVSEKTIGSWKSKSKDNWKGKLNGVLQSSERSTPIKIQSKKSKEKVAESDDISTLVTEDGLTDKQRLFCMYYVRSLNATSAYKKVYDCSYQAAMANGSRLLSNAKVKETIAELKKQRLESLDLDKFDVLEKYKAIAFADITDFIDFTQVDSEATETTVEYNPDGSKKSEKTEVVPYTYTKFSMHHSEEIDGMLITELSKGKDGMFKVKLADKMAALAFLAKYTDLLNENERKQLQNEQAKLNIDKTKVEIDKLEKPDSNKQESEIAKMLRRMAGEE